MSQISSSKQGKYKTTKKSYLKPVDINITPSSRKKQSPKKQSNQPSNQVSNLQKTQGESSKTEREILIDEFIKKKIEFNKQKQILEDKKMELIQLQAIASKKLKKH